jgi:hypothetical protein
VVLKPGEMVLIQEVTDDRLVRFQLPGDTVSVWSVSSAVD